MAKIFRMRSFRFESELMEAIERQAGRQRRSVNNYVATVLATVITPQNQCHEKREVAQREDAAMT
jgi:hypothetical protein